MTEPNEPIESSPGDSTDPPPLEHVVDDFDARQTWGEWAVEQLAAGRTAEDVAAELVTNGWGEEDAAEMAEDARRATRHLRGVVTREQVVAENSSRCRKAMALRWFTPILSIASLWRLLNSIVAVWQTRKRARK